jgi:hypothetical protein
LEQVSAFVLKIHGPCLEMLDAIVAILAMDSSAEMVIARSKDHQIWQVVYQAFGRRMMLCSQWWTGSVPVYIEEQCWKTYWCS